MIYELLAILVLPRLTICIRIVSKWQIVYEFDLVRDIYGLNWIGCKL